MKNKIYLLILLIFSLCPTLEAQQSKGVSGFNPNRLIFGGDIGFGISKNYWNLGISPQIGYRFTNSFHAGAGISYLHGESRDDDFYDIKENSLGVNLFAHYYPWKRIVLRVKPEITRTWYESTFYDNSIPPGPKEEKEKISKLVPAVVVGAGFHLQSMMLLLNYELVQNKYSGYSDNVFLSVGFMF